MAIFSTHLLNSVNGTHAANVKIIIYKIHEDKRNIFIEGETDNSGRMQNEFELTKEDCESNYEMIIESGNYFNETSEIINEISVKIFLLIFFLIEIFILQLISIISLNSFQLKATL